MTSTWRHVLLDILTKLETEPIDYIVVQSSALALQHIDIASDHTIEINVQWDLFPQAHHLFQAVSAIEKMQGGERFSFEQQGIVVSISCYYNTVIVTDPDRVAVEFEGRQIWVKALDYYPRYLAADHPWVKAIKAYWEKLQQQNSQHNEAAWNQDAYDAWVHRLGTPVETATRLKKDPPARLTAIYPYVGELSGKKVINLLGSHGAKAIAMALLGAEVTVVDISSENAQYARDVAQAADVNLRYIVADVLHLPEAEKDASYDLVLMELGILHYFIDLKPLVTVIHKLLKPGGRLILQDFHPVSTKLITSKGKKHKVTGNYFDKSLTTTTVAFSKHLPDEKQSASRNVYLRKWTLGEIVTAIATGELFIKQLVEEPNTKIDDIGLPKTFTLIAEKTLSTS